ncbi:MAG: hypothetical protein WC788_01100 [Candidatus Paceibacterota bacterium]|jgi:membrane-associated HD superfamily phosphohydrolase
MDLSQLMDLAYSIPNTVDMQQVAAILETVYFIIIIVFIMMLPAEDDLKRKMSAVLKDLCLLLAILSVILFAIKGSQLSRSFYLLSLIAIIVYAILKKYFPKMIEAQE